MSLVEEQYHTQQAAESLFMGQKTAAGSFLYCKDTFPGKKNKRKRTSHKQNLVLRKQNNNLTKKHKIISKILKLKITQGTLKT
jgi:hypothetical protein